MGIKPLSICFLLLLVFRTPAADDRTLNFDEVFSLVRTNISDISEAELRQNAAIGFLKEMGTRAQLVTTNAEPAARPPDAITRRSVFEDQFGFIRIRSVDERLPSAFRQSLGELIRSNDLRGLILDLRYAEGTNYQAAAEAADEFISAGEPLIQFGERQIASTGPSPAAGVAVAVLVNDETRAGAEALAAILREHASALLIGKRTKGEARLYETFTLSTGQKLLVGKVPIAVGGGKIIPASGIEPDIEVTIDAAEEKLFYQDPYRERPPTTRPSGASTAANRTRSLNEAELVRRHREGFDFSEEDPSAAATENQTITDPALSRAIDFLKGVSKLMRRPPL